jgi:hypothetical protein
MAWKNWALLFFNPNVPTDAFFIKRFARHETDANALSNQPHMR